MINLYFISASGLFGLHNYCALTAHGQRLKLGWHLTQFACIGLFVYAGISGLWQYLHGTDLWILLGVNILAGSTIYNIVLHGLKYINFKIPRWFLKN